LRTMYRRLRRRFIFAGSVGSEFQATNGILQGCPLSVILLNALVAVWAKAVREEVPDAIADAYVDDTGAVATRPKHLQKVLDITGEFATLTGQTLNTKKCKSFATTTASMHRLSLNGVKLDRTEIIKAVGVHIAAGHPVADLGVARMSEAAGLAERVRVAPLPFEVRVKLMESLVLPKGLHECTAAPVSKRELGRFGHAILRGILGKKRGRACAEVVMTLFGPGHRIDPQQAVPYRALAMLHRMIHKRPDLHHLMRLAWVGLRGHTAAAGGPLWIIQQALREMGAVWVSLYIVKLHGGVEVDLRHVEAEAWAHVVREQLRLTMWRKAAARRNDMQGIEHGIDRDATQALLMSSKLELRERAALRSILTGDVWTQDRACRAHLQPSGVCPFCSSGEVEDHRHLWWHCPAWRGIRERHQSAIRYYGDSWPECLRSCGLMPSDMEVYDWEAAMCGNAGDCLFRTPPSSEQAADCEQGQAGSASNDAQDDVISISSSDVDGPQDGSCGGVRRGPYGEAIVNDRVVVFTDGACKGNQFQALRRAGMGAFWADGHPFNFGQPIGEGEQTNNRAELLAVIRVLQIEARAVDIRTDSKYVWDGAVKHRFKWRQAAWRGKRRLIVNADLWRQLDKLLAERSSADVVFTKVKAHATQQDVSDGVISAFDREGNTAADQLAVAGACVLEGDGGRRRAAWLRAAAVVSVQRMMVDILLARRAAARREQTEHLAGELECEADIAVSEGEADPAGSDSGSGSGGTSNCSGDEVWAAAGDSEYEFEPD
jgi:ribonuclease HI